MRPGNFSKGGHTCSYRHGFTAADKSLELKISHADVADFMLLQLADDTYLRQSPGLSYRRLELGNHLTSWRMKMTAGWFLIASEVSVIACGLVAGVFLTLSDFVMKSLAATKPASGIESMQIINGKVYKTRFMVLLLGMSALSPLLIGYAYFYVSGSASSWVIAGGTIYLVGVFLVSLVFNVPMNQRLDAMEYSLPIRFTPTPTRARWAQTGYRGARHGCSRPRRSPIPAFATRVPATFPR